MALVRIDFDGGDVPVVTGSFPPDPNTPIQNPTSTGEDTNTEFPVPPGIYCYGLDTTIPHTPLWRRVQAIDGQTAVARFTKKTGP